MSLHTDRFAEELTRMTGEFGAGEEVAVTLGATTRTIRALVARDVAVPPENAAGLAPRIVLRVKNSTTEGFTPSEFGSATTKTVSIAARLGDTASARPLGRIVQHNASFVEVEVR